MSTFHSIIGTGMLIFLLELQVVNTMTEKLKSV